MPSPLVEPQFDTLASPLLASGNRLSDPGDPASAFESEATGAKESSEES
jgi:hypothetical protein